MIQSSPRLCTWFALVCSLLLAPIGCKSTAANELPRPDQVVGKPGDCDLLEQRLCAFAGDTAPACEASRLMLDVLTDTSCAQNLKDFAEVQQKHAEHRKPCDELMSQVCEKVGPEGIACKTVRDQTTALVPRECELLLKDTSNLIDNLKLQEVAAKPLDATNQARIAGTDAPSFGPKDAKVTLVEFSDFECPYCARAAIVTQQVKKEYGDRVRFVFRQFPLSTHANAHAAAQASLIANSYGKFWEYHDKLFQNQGKLDRASLIEYAKSVGIDAAKFEHDLSADAFNNAPTIDQMMGSAVAVAATPTLFINGVRVQDPGHWDSVKDAIEKALAASPGG